MKKPGGNDQPILHKKVKRRTQRKRLGAYKKPISVIQAQIHQPEKIWTRLEMLKKTDMKWATERKLEKKQY